jgi:hypothetical protein
LPAWLAITLSALIGIAALGLVLRLLIAWITQD